MIEIKQLEKAMEYLNGKCVAILGDDSEEAMCSLQLAFNAARSYLNIIQNDLPPQFVKDNA